MKPISFESTHLIWQDRSFPVPWDKGALSIHDHLAGLLKAGIDLESADLPDEARRAHSSGLRFASGARDNISCGGPGNPEMVVAAIHTVIRKPDNVNLDVPYQFLCKAALANGADADFRIAQSIAGAVGVDAWRVILSRQSTHPTANFWLYLMQTRETGRAAKAVASAEEQLPLEEIATGPALEMRFGQDRSPHSALDCIVQSLGQFAPLGWRLIRTALRSPVIRNRSMAVKALSEWDKAEWPDDALDAVRNAIKDEPDEKVREHLEELVKPGPARGSRTSRHNGA